MCLNLKQHNLNKPSKFKAKVHVLFVETALRMLYTSFTAKGGGISFRQPSGIKSRRGKQL